MPADEFFIGPMLTSVMPGDCVCAVRSVVAAIDASNRIPRGQRAPIGFRIRGRGGAKWPSTDDGASRCDAWAGRRRRPRAADRRHASDWRRYRAGVDRGQSFAPQPKASKPVLICTPPRTIAAASRPCSGHARFEDAFVEARDRNGPSNAGSSSEVRLSINGRLREADVESRKSLLDTLRETSCWSQPWPFASTASAAPARC